MDPKSIPRLQRLTRVRHVWELALPRLDVSLEEGGRIDRLLLVWGEGRVRLARPVPAGGEALAGLEKAFLDPTGGGRPGLPAALRCADPALAEAIRRALGALVPVEVAATPSADRATRELLSRLVPIAMPGITTGAGLWRVVLQRLAGLAPWEKLSEEAEFRFAGADLDGSVGRFLGHREAPEGFEWFPTARDHERSLGGPAEGEADDARAVQVQLHPADQVDPEAVAQAEKLGLELDGRIPWVFTSVGGAGEPASPVEQQRALRACSAALELFALHGAELAEGRAAGAEVGTADARRIQVDGTPAPVAEEE